MTFWRALRTVHIHLSLATFVLLAFFGVTGVLLVHADSLGLDVARERVVTTSVPPALLASDDRLAVVEHLRQAGATGAVTDYVADDDEVRVVFERPGARCEATIGRPAGACELALIARGATALLLDLHTGKSAGPWWIAIDVAGGLWLAVALTGFVLWLQLKKRRRFGVLWLTIGAAASWLAYALLTP